MSVVLGVTFIYYPVKSYIVDGKLVPLLPTEFMFLDQSNELDFLFANFIQVILCTYGSFGILYVGVGFIVLIKNLAPRVDIVEIDFNELDELWSDTSTSTLAYRHMFLRNICLKYVDIREYTSQFLTQSEENSI